MAAHQSHCVSISLRGAGQVFFLGNALAGALFIAAIAYAAFDSHHWAPAGGALLGLIIATGTALGWMRDRSAVRAGLYGFNGILVGVALPTFLAASPWLWAGVVLGAAASTVAVDLFSALLTRRRGIPGSTGPFVAVTWLLLAGALALGGQGPVAATPLPATSAYLAGAAALPSLAEAVQIFFRNIAQVFLLGSAVSGALVLLGVALASRRAALAVVAGSLVSMACALALRANPAAVLQGLWGFSPILTAMALGVVYLPPSRRTACYALLGTLTTVLLQTGADALAARVGLPMLTAPYLLTLYAFMGLAPYFRLTPPAIRPAEC
ncbi:urea transporter [Castellaniella hirudinis]|uniref:urea transporter n=1 Tax=Castellaniella hirudinis TaxID=1144617 RepID=UPI0039C18F0E